MLPDGLKYSYSQVTSKVRGADPSLGHKGSGRKGKGDKIGASGSFGMYLRTG